MTRPSQKRVSNVIRLALVLSFLALAACDGSSGNLALGTLERDRIAHTATASEVVVELPVPPGSPVEKGSVLVKLDDTLQRAEVDRASAQLSEAVANLEKLRHGARPEEVAAARANVAGARAELIESEANYSRILNLRNQNLASQADLDKAIADFFGDSTNTVVFFGIQSADCNVVMNAIRAAGVETDVVASGSCIDDSVLANPSAVGAFFGQQGYISERPDLYDPFIGFQLGVREALLDDSPLRTAPVSAFLRVGHATGIMVWQVLERMLADGQDIDDRAAINSAFVSMENQHVVGTPPVNCTDNTPEFPAVCKKDLTFTVWNGSEWELGPLGGELISVRDIQARVAAGNPRAAC